jgi:hypothetical protein
VGDDEAEKDGPEARFNVSRVVRSDFTKVRSSTQHGCRNCPRSRTGYKEVRDGAARPKGNSEKKRAVGTSGSRSCGRTRKAWTRSPSAFRCPGAPTIENLEPQGTQGCTEEPGYLIRLSFLIRPIQLAPPGLVQKSLIVFILPRARQKKSRPDIRRLVNNPVQNYNKWCGGFSSFPVFGPVLDGAAGWVPLPSRGALR